MYCAALSTYAGSNTQRRMHLISLLRPLHPPPTRSMLPKPPSPDSQTRYRQELPWGIRYRFPNLHPPLCQFDRMLRFAVSPRRRCPTALRLLNIWTCHWDIQAEIGTYEVSVSWHTIAGHHSLRSRPVLGTSRLNQRERQSRIVRRICG